MKKLLNLIVLLTLAAFAMPLLTVGLGAEDNVKTTPADGGVMAEAGMEVPDRKGYDTTTKITLCTENTVREMTLREYLIGVLAAEMPAGFPEEALKAQAVAARTYTLYKIALYSDESKLPESHMGAQLCDNSTHCEAFSDLAVTADSLWGGSAQIYRGRVEAAVDATDGLILTYQDAPIAAVFCSASAEKTERAEDVWGAAVPYLISVDSPGGEDCSRYRATVSIAQKTFSEAVKQAYPAADFSGTPAAWFRDSHRTEAGSVKDVLVGGVRVSGSFVRQTAELNSANFTVQASGSDLVFTTVGCGHGVGLSQYGARYYAMAGKTYDEILAHYYPGTELLLKG